MNSAYGAGSLTPVGSGRPPLEIRSHDVKVIINNGFACTEVIQVFHNPTAEALEAVYSFPLPRSASLSEMSVTAGERTLHGEVLGRSDARQVYEEERDQGQNAGLAEKHDYHEFRFHVSHVPGHGEAQVRFLYYQPLEIDTAVGRYCYPLEEGGTDDAGRSFWQRDARVLDRFSFDLQLESAWPVIDVRVPGFEAAMQQVTVDERHRQVRIELPGSELSRDVVLYYRLADDLPGAVEVLSTKPSAESPGTFMVVVTPALDLAPLTAGSDICFVLDLSGSMQDKMRSLVAGMKKAIEGLRAEDRFRLVTFSTRAHDVTGWKAATPDNVQRALTELERMQANGSTNLFEGLRVALSKLDDDRATSLVLITDAVTNTGIIDPTAFHKLMQQFDVRVFGFLMGNSANVPLMRVVCDATGGFQAQVSNADDIVGQVLLARSKVTHECLHDARLEIRGVPVQGVTGEDIGKVYRGQQLVLFGRYDRGGEATLTLAARLTGEDKQYQTRIVLPDVDPSHPELERLWALARIEDLEYQMQMGALPGEEGAAAIRGLGLEYQLVTDETSMVALSDETFARRGVARLNQERVAREHAARAERGAPVAETGTSARGGRPQQPDPMFGNQTRPAVGGGAGALDPLTVAGLALVVGALALRRRRPIVHRDASSGKAA